MDESWRMRMGMPEQSRRRSTEETSSDRSRSLFGGGAAAGGGGAAAESLRPDDFSDVFGGPPRTVLSHQYSTTRARSRSTSFYEEIFRPPEGVAPAKGGRMLPVFSIPASRSRQSEGFYSDIFGSEDDRRSRSRSKVNSKATNSSSVLSSEEVSPLRPEVNGDDLTFSCQRSKLRPVNVPFRWSSSTMMQEEHPNKQEMPAFSCSRASHFEDQFIEIDYNDYYGSSSFGFSRQVTSPETISLEPNSYRSIRVSVEDLEMNSPSSVVEPESYRSVKVSSEDVEMNSPTSVVSSVCQDAEAFREDEVMRSYVIEINADRMKRSDAADAIDEAIAWAKEKYQKSSPKREWNVRQCDNVRPSETKEMRSDGQIRAHELLQTLMEKNMNTRETAAEEKEKQQTDKMQKELQLLDEDVKLWSAGKETNIRALLSTLHHILWPNSGWQSIPLTNLIESAQVKKAYQKARLCLHPDKLQQRGATLLQRHVSEKAFSILQDSWGAFITQDIFFG